MFACAPVGAADGVDITRAGIESSDDGYKLRAAYSFDLNRDLEDAVQHGVKLYFTTEIELTRPRWYWFDEKAIVSKRTSQLYYTLLTRQYHVLLSGSVRQSFPTLEEALFLIRRPNPWLFAGRGALKTGENYNVTLRMVLDRNYLSKPIQVNAFNNADWSLGSNRKAFTYRAE